MSTLFAVSTILEFLVVGLLIFGYIHEKKVIAFEDRAVEWICRRIARSKRKKRLAQQRAALYTGQHGRVSPDHPNRAA